MKIITSEDDYLRRLQRKMDIIKAIFLDMDGTILHEDNTASGYTKEVIDQLRAKGYKVFLATGRSYAEINQLVPKGFTVDGIISSNGTSGEVKAHNIFRHSLTQEAVNKIVQLAQQQHIYYEVFPFEGQRLALQQDESWMRGMVREEEPQNNVGISEWRSRKDALKGKINWVKTLPETSYSKIYLFTTDLAQITQFRQSLIDQQLSLNISVSNSSRFNAETMAYGVDKGSGIAEMIAHFGIQQQETLVIGDSDNDRAMFKYGHVTVAMKNARPEIKDLTDDITVYDNEEDGAARYLADRFL